MKLLRYGPRGQERPAVLTDAGMPIDVSEIVDDYDRAFLAGGGMARLRAALKARDDLPRVSLDGGRIGPPIARPGTIACIGLNYEDHAAESGVPLPEEPVVFFKATNTVVGPIR